jgi:hypothetical protein
MTQTEKQLREPNPLTRRWGWIIQGNQAWMVKGT